MEHVSEILPAIAKQKAIRDQDIKRLSPIKARLLAPQVEWDILYQHTVFCQTSLPYRDPGDDTRTWERRNGNVHLEINAGKAMHPELDRMAPVGLPFGPKSRLVLMYINQRAIQEQSPVVEVDDSLTKFVRRVLKLAPHGRNIRAVKDQLARLAASSIRLGVVKDGRALTINTQVVTAFDIWFPKDERQRVLWPSTIRLSLDYWESLKIEQSAVPLVEEHIVALSHSAMALDVYTWLTHRLRRIDPRTCAFVPWTSLHAQFGQGYERLRDFRRAFLHVLSQVHMQYPKARFEVNQKGMRLYQSPSPVPQRLFRAG